MAAGEFSFDLRDLDGVASLLEKAKLSSKERMQLLKNIGVEVETQTQERFDTQLSPEGKRWQELAEKTRKYYARKFPGHRRSILVGSGGLRDSIESQVGDWSVLVGATKIYAATHQYGRRNIPSRPYLGISSSNAADIMAITQEFLVKLITGKAV